MLYFKSCPRCKGDMHFDIDVYGPYKACLMCGYMVNLRLVARPKVANHVAAKTSRSAA
jgi:hypothetical protein